MPKNIFARGLMGQLEAPLLNRSTAGKAPLATLLVDSAIGIEPSTFWMPPLQAVVNILTRNVEYGNSETIFLVVYVMYGKCMTIPQ